MSRRGVASAEVELVDKEPYFTQFMKDLYFKAEETDGIQKKEDGKTEETARPHILCIGMIMDTNIM